MPRAKSLIERIPQLVRKPLEAVSAPMVLHEALDFEEALNPPDLEDTLADEETQLENAPPLYARVCGFCRVAVGALADNDIGLLVFYLGDELGKGADC